MEAAWLVGSSTPDTSAFRDLMLLGELDACGWIPPFPSLARDPATDRRERMPRMPDSRSCALPPMLLDRDKPTSFTRPAGDQDEKNLMCRSFHFNLRLV